MSSEMCSVHIYSRERKLYHYYYHLGGYWVNKNFKKNLPGNILNNHVSVFSLSISPFQPARCAKIPYKESFFKLNFPFSTTGQSKCTGSFNSGAPTSTMQQMKKAKMTKQHRQTTWQRRKRYNNIRLDYYNIRLVWCIRCFNSVRKLQPWKCLGDGSVIKWLKSSKYVQRSKVQTRLWRSSRLNTQ